MDRFPSAARRRLPLKTALLLAVLSATSPAMASVDTEAGLAEDIVRQAVIDLDTVKEGERRVMTLSQAVEAMSVLEHLAIGKAGNAAARTALETFAREAITPDVLRLSLLEALAEGISDPAARLQRDLDAKAVLEKIIDPAYRSAAWSELARAHMKSGHADEAERLAVRALEEAQAIDRDETRDGALRAAILVFPATALPHGLVDIATNRMTTAKARSEIYQILARAALEGANRPAKGELARRTRQALDQKRLADALTSVQALDRDEEVRSNLLRDILTAALAAGDETLALETAKSMNRDSEQNKALRRIVDLRIERGKALRAQEIAPLFLTPKARIDAEIAVARALDDTGYHQAALDILRASTLSPADEPAGAANLAAAFAGLAAYEDADRLAQAIPDAEDRSFAFSRISKRLADDGRIKEAEAYLDRIEDSEARSHALSGVARALAKDGEFDKVTAMLETIAPGEDRDRVLEELARQYAQAGRMETARALLDRAMTPEAICRILVTLALEAGERNPGDVRTTLAEAAAKATSLHSEEGLAEVAVAYARIGEAAQSDKILDTISDHGIRQDAERRIVDLMVKQGALAPAGERLQRLAGPDREKVQAGLAYAAFEKDGDVEALVAAVRDFSYHVRVPVLRRMSEARARTLDTSGWLSDPSVDPIAASATKPSAQKANFTLGQHLVKAPAPETRSLKGVAMPDVFALSADTMRARMPAPAGGVGHLAILGFSPFSLEAFKLTSGGTAAIHQVQMSQQLTWPRYIAIEKGVVTLGSLLRDLPEARWRNLLVAEGDMLLVRGPIIVLPGATLLMSGAEFSQYRLAAKSGAFIAVAGKLVVQDAEIVGYDETTGTLAVADEANKSVFRPFITGWGGSDLQISGSRLAMLGYDSSKAFGLTQSSGAAIQSLYAVDENRPRGNIVDNSFENLRYGYYSYEATAVNLVGNEYRDNVVYGIDPHDRSRNLLIALNTAYGSHKKHGIIVSREVDDSFIVGNVSLWNKGSGVMLDRTSARNIVYANTAVANKGDGLTFYESGCNIAAANDFSRNHRAGVKIRNSTDIGMYDNRIDDNETSGVDVYVADLRASPEGQSRNFVMDPYEPVSTAVISGNSFAANGNAVNVAGASRMVLDANHFRNQSNNIYGGDLRQLSPYLLQLGETSAMLVSTSCKPAPAISQHACRLGNWPQTDPADVVCTGMSMPQKSGGEIKEPRDG